MDLDHLDVNKKNTTTTMNNCITIMFDINSNHYCKMHSFYCQYS